MEHFDTAIVAIVVLVALIYCYRWFWKSQHKKEPCCGKGCGCITSKLKSKFPAKKA